MRTAEAYSYEAEQALIGADEESAFHKADLLVQQAQVWATLSLAAATQAADLRRFPGIG